MYRAMLEEEGAFERKKSPTGKAKPNKKGLFFPKCLTRGISGHKLLPKTIIG